MSVIPTRVVSACAITLTLTLGGCSDDAANDEPGSCPGVDSTGCTVTVGPGNDSVQSYERLQQALIDTQSGSTVCLCPGSYTFERQLSLTVPNVTVRGLGQTLDDVVFDFAGQTADDDAFKVTSDGFTIENLSLKNSPGNGIVVTGAEDVVFRKLKVSWDAGSVTDNGAYAVYPVQSTRVTVEDSIVSGAADAGIYVGQCNDVIVRRNTVYGNVLGIEIENSTNAEVYENESYDNTAGVAVFVLSNLDKKDGKRTLVRDNDIHGNNRANFGEPDSVVSYAPSGSGVLLLAADETEVRNNTIADNDSIGVMVLSLNTLALVGVPADDPNTDPYPESNFIHSNTFTGNGENPQSLFTDWTPLPLENVMWDGTVDPAKTVKSLCMGEPPDATYRNFHVTAGGLGNPAQHTFDSAEVTCKLEPHPGVSF